MPAAAAFGHRIRRAAQRAGAATLDSLAGSPRAFEDLAAALQATLNVGAMLATQLGRHALAHGDAVTARAALEQALALGDDDLDMLPDLAAAHVALGHPRDALQQLSDVSERDLPLTHALRVGLARTQALHALGDEDGARRALDRAARACGSPTGTPLQAGDIPILRSLAEQASQLERPDLSAHFLQHVVTLHPTSVSAYTALAHAFVAVGEITAARSAALSALSLAPAKAHAHSLMASTLMQTADDAASNPKQALKHWQRAAELTPDDLEVLIGLAQSATQAGQAKLGLTSAERALELAEGAAASDGAVEALQDLQGRAHTALAEALEAMDDREGAFEHFQCATAACPTAPEAWRAVAQHHLRRDERRRALAALEAGRQAVGTANPVGAAALLGDLAQLQLDSQQPTEAIDTYRTASQLHPRNAEYRSRLGKLLLAQGQLEEGIASLREAARLSPAQPALWHDLGQALEEDGRDGEALGALEQALSAGGSSFSLAQDIGRLALRLGRHDLARPALLEAAESPHATADTFALLGSLHETAGEFEAAINAYERVLAMQPERNDILVRLGVCSLQAGRPSAAIATLRGAAEQDLEDLALQTTLAEAYLQEGLLEEAALSFEHAARLAPDDSRIWRKLAETARRAGDLKSAISALEHAVQLSPDRAELMAALGELYAGAERWEAARDMLLQALEIDDSRPQTHASLGRCLLALGDRDGGMAAYEQAAMLAPGDLAIF
ncbi:MAG: tetratricopeptide repeat protein, partial [Anaerolineales bacterium]